MKILLLGAAGFIGTNLTIELAKKTEDEITLVDRSKAFFKPIVSMDLKNVHILEADLTVDMDFDSILKDQEVVYHLVSTTVPTTSNQHISQELVSNVIFSANLFEACIRCGVKKVVFVSSGGTVYGKEVDCPLKEKTATNPISSYGVQKITIEKLLYLYRYMYGLDYRIIRLANPYGPYQRPNGVLGAVTTFTYKALKGDEITVYGDGSVVRDFIYIDDAIRAIMKIVNGENKHRTFNLGCGYGTSIKQVLETIEKALGIKLNVSYPQPFDWDALLGLLHKKAPRRSSYEAQLSDSDSLVTTTQIAKEYGCGAKVFNRLLHLHGIQYRANGQWVLYSEHHGKGYTSSLTFRLQRSDGSEVEKLHTAWTQKGRKFLYHTLKRRGVLPLAEQGG